MSPNVLRKGNTTGKLKRYLIGVTHKVSNREKSVHQPVNCEINSIGLAVNSPLIAFTQSVISGIALNNQMIRVSILSLKRDGRDTGASSIAKRWRQ